MPRPERRSPRRSKRLSGWNAPSLMPPGPGLDRRGDRLARCSCFLCRADRGLASACDRHGPTALVLGACLGALSAIALAASPMARALIRPMLVFSQAVPGFALAPILTLWLGFGLWSKITMALIIIYFPVTSAFFDALKRTNRDWLGMAKVMGATPARIMWHIRIPAALPGLASGLRLAAVYAPIGAVIGEW